MDRKSFVVDIEELVEASDSEDERAGLSSTVSAEAFEEVAFPPAGAC